MSASNQPPVLRVTGISASYEVIITDEMLALPAGQFWQQVAEPLRVLREKIEDLRRQTEATIIEVKVR